MKYSVRKRGGALRRAAAALLVVFALVGCAGVTAAGDKPAAAPAVPTTMTDPLLGLRYDTGRIRFERLPAALARKAGLTPPQWIYARSDRDGATVYVVSGFQRIESDDPDRSDSAIEPDFGAVLKSKDGKVDVLGVPDRLHGDEAIVTPQELEPLLADAVRRYIEAWGGKKALQQELDTFERPDAVPVSLREALQTQDLRVGVAGAR